MIAVFLRRAIAIAVLGCAGAACSDDSGGLVLDEHFEYRYDVITGENDIGEHHAGGVIRVSRLEIREGATLRIIGGPAAILVEDEAVIDGRIELLHGGRNDPSCIPNFERIVGDVCGGGTGGGGAQPGTVGGTCTVEGVAHRGGQATPVIDTELYDERYFGGCLGGPGGPNPVAGDAPRGFAGAGGGGLRIVAGDAIHIGRTAVLDANGEGGEGGQSFDGAPAGGGGGGAGGTIVLEAEHIGIDGGGHLCANGGAGGAGSAQPDGRIAGADGERGPCERANAAGGAGPGARGGNGGSNVVSMPGANGTGDTATGSAQGGGGGGGAAGRIWLRSNDTSISSTAVISPDPS